MLSISERSADGVGADLVHVAGHRLRLRFFSLYFFFLRRLLLVVPGGPAW